MSIVSERKILVTPDFRTGTWIEKRIREVAHSRGTKAFSRGSLVAACVRGIAECPIQFAVLRSEAHISARISDLILKGLAAERQQQSTELAQSQGATEKGTN